jgi:hypothetical protein
MAEEKTPAKAEKEAAAPAKEPLVYLYLGMPHARFDLSGVGLPDLIPGGTAYTRADADIVRVLCAKYGIRVNEAE